MPIIIFGLAQPETEVNDFPDHIDRKGKIGPLRVRAGETATVTSEEAEHLRQKGIAFSGVQSDSEQQGKTSGA